MPVATAVIKGARFEITDEMWGPILTIKVERDRVINTIELLLNKEDLQYLANTFQHAANHPSWFTDHSLMQGDFDCIGRPSGGANLDQFYESEETING